MKKASSLDLVRGMVQSKAQVLAGEVGHLMREKEDAQQMLLRLTEYAADYSSAASTSGGALRSVLSIENQRQFVGKLNAALEQQRSTARRIEERTDIKLNSWQRACADLEAVDRLIARRARASEDTANRQQQRESDAMALRRFASTESNQDDGA